MPPPARLVVSGRRCADGAVAGPSLAGLSLAGLSLVALSLAGLSLVALSLVGCGGGEGSDAAVVPPDAACPLDGAGVTPWIVLGTGDTSFVSLADGDDLELVHGPQGGYHLLTTALLGLAVSPEAHVLRYDVSGADGTVLGTTQVALNERRLTRTCGGWFRGGDRVVLTIAGPADVVGTDVELVVSVLDADGEVVRDARHLHVIDDAP